MKNKFNIISGLAKKNAFALGDGAGDHARSAAAWLTGCHPRKTSGANIKAGVSFDQILAREFANKKRFGSLELGCERGGLAGDCDSGYSCAYSNSISWRTESTPVAKEVDPRLVFERLLVRKKMQLNLISSKISLLKVQKSILLRSRHSICGMTLKHTQDTLLIDHTLLHILCFRIRRHG